MFKPVLAISHQTLSLCNKDHTVNAVKERSNLLLRDMRKALRKIIIIKKSFIIQGGGVCSNHCVAKASSDIMEYGYSLPLHCSPLKTKLTAKIWTN